MNLYREAKKLNPLHTLTSGDIKDVDSVLLVAEVEMELTGHDKDTLYYEKVKTLAEPNPKCSKCHGRGHKGYLTRKNRKGEDTGGFVLCKCVLKN